MRLGPELEFTIFDRQGNLQNDSYKIIKTIREEQGNPLTEYVCPEASKVLIEMGCAPAESLDELVTSFVGVLDVLVRGAEKRGLLLAPVSTFIQDTNIEISEEARHHWILPIIGAGPGQRPPGLQVTATQVHIDAAKTPEGKLKQFTFATAIDSAFAFMSHSCFYDGVYRGNDMRVPVFRFDGHFPFPRLGNLVPYQQSFDALTAYFEENKTAWVDRLRYLNQDITLAATKTEGPFGYFWGHPRFTFKKDKNTLEMRSPDANITSNCFAYFALVKGAFLALKDVTLDIQTESSYPRDNFFTVKNGGSTPERLILPPFNYLTSLLQDQAYNYGLKVSGIQTDGVHSYLTKVLAFAKRGLPQEEHHYLEPFESMLETRENWSDDLLRYARANHLVRHEALVPNGAKQLRLHANECFMNDFKKYKHLLSQH